MLVGRLLRSVGIGGGGSRRHPPPAAAEAAPWGGADAATLECPVCWEGFDAAAHTPCVLFCGHTLCRGCVLGLHWATLKLPPPLLHLHLPLLVACPWCQSLTPRFFWHARLKFPAKNYFLLSLLDSSSSSSSRSRSRKQQQQDVDDDDDDADAQQQQQQQRLEQHNKIELSSFFSMGSMLSGAWQLGFGPAQRNEWHHVFASFASRDWSWPNFRRLFVLLAQLVAKLPLMCLLLFLLVYVIPFSLLVLLLYCMITLGLAMPSYLVLYFSLPCLVWLAREIAAA